MPNCNFKLEKGQVEETTGEKRPYVLSDAIQVIECTWVRELDNAQNDLPIEDHFQRFLHHICGSFGSSKFHYGVMTGNISRTLMECMIRQLLDLVATANREPTVHQLIVERHIVKPEINRLS